MISKDPSPINFKEHSELLKLSFSFLDVKGRANVNAVSKRWHEISNADRLWQEFIQTSDLFPLGNDNPFKQRFDLNRRWRRGDFSLVSELNDVKQDICFNQHFFRFKIDFNTVTFSNLETNENFSLSTDRKEPIEKVDVFLNHIILSTKKQYHIFNRQTHQLIRSIESDTSLISKYINEDYFVVSNGFMAKIWKIENGKLIWDNPIVLPCGLYKNILYTCNFSKYIDLSLQVLKLERRRANNFFVFKDAENGKVVNYVKINATTVRVAIANLGDLTLIESKLFSAPNPFEPILSIKIIGNIIIIISSSCIYAFDINDSKLLFCNKIDDDIIDVYVQRNRIIVKVTKDQEMRFLIYDFGKPTSIIEPVNKKQVAVVIHKQIPINNEQVSVTIHHINRGQIPKIRAKFISIVNGINKFIDRYIYDIIMVAIAVFAVLFIIFADNLSKKIDAQWYLYLRNR